MLYSSSPQMAVIYVYFVCKCNINVMLLCTVIDGAVTIMKTFKIHIPQGFSYAALLAFSLVKPHFRYFMKHLSTTYLFQYQIVLYRYCKYILFINEFTLVMISTNEVCLILEINIVSIKMSKDKLLQHS